jgi:hypothetical protein
MLPEGSRPWQDERRRWPRGLPRRRPRHLLPRSTLSPPASVCRAAGQSFAPRRGESACTVTDTQPVKNVPLWPHVSCGRACPAPANEIGCRATESPRCWGAAAGQREVRLRPGGPFGGGWAVLRGAGMMLMSIPVISVSCRRAARACPQGGDHRVLRSRPTLQGWPRGGGVPARGARIRLPRVWPTTEADSMGGGLREDLTQAADARQ